MIENAYNSKYIYKAFGLTIASEIMLPDLVKSEGTEDIRIKLGKVPSEIQSILEKTNEYQISKTEFIFSVKDVAHYYIKDGRLIVVEPEENADINDIKLYLMGIAIGTIFIQRGIVPIHGSSVVIGNRCVIFTGDCGAGKSTICSAFRRNGCEFLSDDISVITMNKVGAPMVQPAFPQQRLCIDAAKEMGYDTSVLLVASKTNEKLVINGLNGFKAEPIQLAAIFKISQKEEDNVKITKVVGTEKLISILESIYCSAILFRLGINSKYFKQCTNIGKKISYYNLVRPSGKFTVDEQVKLVIENINTI